MNRFQLVDTLGIAEVTAFVELKMSGFDTSKVDWFRLKPLACKNGAGHGYCKYPERVKKGSRQFKHHYRLNAGVNQNQAFPYRWEMQIGSETHPTKPQIWSYVTEDVVFADPAEYAVWICGHEAYHFLRHSRQVPGRNTQVQANLFGLNWLKEFRKTR